MNSTFAVEFFFLSIFVYGKMIVVITMEQWKEAGKLLIIIVIGYLAITAFLLPAKWIGGTSFLMTIVASLARRIPFGHQLGQLSLYLTTHYLPIVPADELIYIDIFNAPASQSIIDSVAQLCLLGIIYVLINALLFKILGIEKGISPVRIVERIMVNVIAAIFAVMASTYVISWIMNYVSSIDVNWVRFVPYIVTALSVGGSLIVTLIKLAFATIAIGLLFYLIRFVILNILKLVMTYVLTFSLLICLIEGHIGLFIGQYVALMIIIGVIVGMDLICNHLFGVSI